MTGGSPGCCLAAVNGEVFGDAATGDATMEVADGAFGREPTGSEGG